MRTRVPVVVVLASILAAGTASAATGGTYEPKVGDTATSWVRTAKAGKGAEFKKVMKGHLGPAMKADEVLDDTFLLVDEKEIEFVGIRFNAPAHGSKSPHKTPLEAKLKGLEQGSAKISSYKVVLAVNAGFAAKEGDKVTVFVLQAKKDRLEDAKAIFRDQLMPVAKADAPKRACLLLEDAAGNTLVGVTFLKGEASSDPKLVEKEKLLEPLLEKPAHPVTYTLYHINDE
jgi:hypothetical protein